MVNGRRVGLGANGEVGKKRGLDMSNISPMEGKFLWQAIN